MEFHDSLEKIRKNGYVVIKDMLDLVLVDEINDQIDHLIKSNHLSIHKEENDTAVRSLLGPHLYSDFFLDICKLDELVNICELYLKEQVYVHQFKINTKSAITGRSWPWHQDYIYWREGDHIKKPSLLNVSIALDDINMISGPLCVIPGSHKLGNVSTLKGFEGVGIDSWNQDVSENLTYLVGRDNLKSLINSNGYEFLVCKKGDLIVFDPQLVHCSAPNISSDDRKLLIITYNAVGNKPESQSKRPEFLCSTNYTPIREQAFKSNFPE